MSKLGKRILSLLIVAVLVCTMLPLSASALSGSYGNGTWSDVEGNFYIIKPDGTQEQVTGWKTTITNPGQTFTLWFPNPYYYGSTFSGYIRYTAGEHGTGSYSEKLSITYYESTRDLGYEIYLLPTAAELEQEGILPDVGYKFGYYEITYWNRDSSSSDFTKRTERFNPGDIMPYDVNLRGKYATTQGYLDIKVIYVEDESAAVDYTLNYDANGGNGAPAAQTMRSTTGSATFTVSNTVPTREGYTFKGWADTADATTAGYLGGDPLTVTKDAPNKTIYAVWEKVIPQTTYTLTYDANGGENAPAQQTATNNLGKADFQVSSAVPTRDGYTFKGWADTTDATVADYLGGDTITVTGAAPNKTIYAVWEKLPEYTYTLTYDANGGENAPVAEPVTTTAESYTFTVSSQKPTREGYEFLGWADTADATTAGYQAGDEITLTKDASSKTIYAVWAKQTTYTLTYDANGGENAPKAQTATNTMGYARFQVSSDEPTRDGYTFQGWADTADATEANYHGADSIRLEADAPEKTLYAVWEKIPEYTYTLTYAPNGENVTGMPEAQTVTTTATSHEFTVSNMTPVREGYNFLGWADTADATAANVAAGATITLTKDAPEKTLYAVWEKMPEYTYTLTYAPNGENVTGMPEAQTVTTTATSHEFTVSNMTPVREGYNFLGWADTADATAANVAAGATITLTKDAPEKTLYAVWEKQADVYTLRFDANGGTGAPETMTGEDTYGDGSYMFVIPTEVPTREGYTFLGWATDANATNPQVAAGTRYMLWAPNFDVTLYAVWKENAPEYTYTLNYGTASDDVTGMPEAQTVTTTAESYDFTVSDATPARKGYVFLGWAETADAAAATIKAGDTITLTKDSASKTIYTVWEKDKSSQPGIEKEEDKTTLNGGETVNYTLTSNVPDYLGDYLALPAPTDPVIVNATGDVTRGSYPLSIYDKLPAGLTYNEKSLSVTIGSTVLPEGMYTLTMGGAEDDFTFRVDMDLVQLYEEGYITLEQIEKAEKIYVKYSATLAEGATPGHYMNTAWVAFEDTKSAEVTVNLTTFGIEVFKYDQSNNKAPLEGAKFTLTDANGNTWTGESDANGIVTFNALAAGTYSLVETEAPKGYVKSDKSLPIVIEEGENAPLVVKTEFANAPIPHTGGEGTATFIILGGTMIGMAVALYLASQKKRRFQV